MAQNGFNRLPNTPTTYPGTATRLISSSSPSSSSLQNGRAGASGNVLRIPTTTTLASIPSVLVRPLSHSQLSSSTTPSSRTTAVSNEPSSPRAPTPPARPISLEQPRPNAERHRNIYMGAPLPSHQHRIINNLSPTPPATTTTGRASSPLTVTTTNTLNIVGHSGGGVVVKNINSANKIRVDSAITAAEQVRLPINSRLKTTSKKQLSDSDNVVCNTQESCSSSSTSTAAAITCQPKKTLSLSLLEDPQQQKDSSSSTRPSEPSIICPYCRKCRCEACATPRPLPSQWICSKSIHCGPEPLLDYVTCLCCVKALFYHCGKNHEPDGGVLCADKPCSCAPHRKFWRWGCMASMSLVLPCLCLYLPCKGCVKLAEKAYQKYHYNGCTCHLNHPHLQQQGNHFHHRHHHHEQGGGMNSLDGPISTIESSEDEDTHKHKHKFMHDKKNHSSLMNSHQNQNQK